MALKTRSKKRRAAFALILALGGILAGAVAFLALGWGGEILPSLLSRLGSPAGPHQAVKSAYRPCIWYHRFAGVNVYGHGSTNAFTESVKPRGRHNSQGFRTPEYTSAHPPDTFRILVIGDSFTYGDGVGQEEAFPRVLEEIFRKKAGGKGARVEVIALGVCGSRTPDNLIRLLAHGRGLSPDLVVFQHYGNDLEFRPLYSYGRYFFTALEPTTLERLPLLGKFFRETEAGQKLADRGREPDLYSRQIREKRRILDAASFERELFRGCLASLARFSEESGIPVAFVAFPMLDGDPEGKNFSGYEKEPVEQVLDLQPLEEIRKRDFPLLDLRETFRKEKRYLAVSKTNGHPNPLAHRLAGEALFDFLLERGLASCPARPGKAEGPGYEKERALRDKAAARWEDYAGDLSLQRKLFEALRANDPKNAWLADELAFCDYSAGDKEAARRCWEEARKLAPGLAAPWAYLGMTRKLPAESEEDYRRMLALLPGQNQALLSLARICEDQGRNEEACGLYSRAARAAEYPGNFQQATDGLSRLSCPAALSPSLGDFQGRPPEPGMEVIMP